MFEIREVYCHRPFAAFAIIRIIRDSRLRELMLDLRGSPDPGGKDFKEAVFMLRQLIRAIPWILLAGAVVLAIVGPPEGPAVTPWKQSRDYKDIHTRLYCERSWVNPGTNYEIYAELRNVGRKQTVIESSFYSAMSSYYLGRLEGEEIGDLMVPQAVISLKPDETYRFLWSSSKDFRLGSHSFGGGFTGFPADTITIWVFPWRASAITLAAIMALWIIVRRVRLLKHEDAK